MSAVNSAYWDLVRIGNRAYNVEHDSGTHNGGEVGKHRDDKGEILSSPA